MPANNGDLVEVHFWQDPGGAFTCICSYELAMNFVEAWKDFNVSGEPSSKRFYTLDHMRNTAKRHWGSVFVDLSRVGCIHLEEL